MVKFSTAYRHTNGDVEGFIGWGFTGAGVAQRSAEQAIREKCEAIGDTFDRDRMITEPSGLTRDELALIRSDWKMLETSR